MKFIAVSQRVDFIKDYGEKRDSLDQRWTGFLYECGCIPVLIPNTSNQIEAFFENIKIEGILLTGGNDLTEYGGITSERDETEKVLIQLAIKKKIPLIGVCRGMQMIGHYFGIKLSPIQNHVRIDHNIRYLKNLKTRIVNSFHNFGFKEISSDFKVVAISDDDLIESFQHIELPILGLMWHPERNLKFDDEDINLFKFCFEVNK